MATLEQVEKLREKASVSFEEAKAALEACNDDLLDAIIWLEKRGKVNAPVAGGYYSSEHNSEGERENESTHQETSRKQGGGCPQCDFTVRPTWRCLPAMAGAIRA